MITRVSNPLVIGLCYLSFMCSNIQGSTGFLHQTSSAKVSNVRSNCRQQDALGASVEDDNTDNTKDILNSHLRLNNINNRRSLLSSTIMGASIALTTMTMNSYPAFAKDELFKKNPLTNPVLEQVSLKLECHRHEDTREIVANAKRLLSFIFNRFASGNKQKQMN